MRRVRLADLVPGGCLPPALDRATLARAIDGWGFARAGLWARRAGSPWLTVLTYHRVADLSGSSELDDGVVDCSPAQLGRQMAFVKRWFDIVTTEDLRAFACERASLPRNPLLVSFDDGYRDNHDVALPILLREGVRATFFVATDYIERRRLYWWDRVSLVIRRSRKQQLKLTYPKVEDLPLDGPTEKERAVRRVQRIIKDDRCLDLVRLLDEVERAADVCLSSDEERGLADALIMTWDHVAALRAAGMDVQSHTHTHRVLQTLGPGELDRELRVSRALLERVLGAPVRAVSYPVGRSVRTSPEIVLAVQAAGYELGFSNGTGVNGIRSFDPFDVRRVAMDRSMPDSLFRATLAFPWLAH
ncbi:MAG TPA: polysaccharide deacetylase family protein [Polyangiaceae bacterium]|nr:polysaccharide deacetylase family protein [Polyangiaceae bacterium]